ncbi:MAG: hypothetical protein R3B47_01135 [Bacteroidia bacterium]
MMTPQASQTQRINIRDFAVWALDTLGSRRMASEALKESWKQVRPHSKADAHMTLKTFTTLLTNGGTPVSPSFARKVLCD